ncbi:hypothetical protein [Streptomyces mobaraensis]|uniref:Uncharacterized protein n=1 Tax=Streptomyces mobaraensis TaxID=35621 RepID=A0A5N5WDN2_STRMB|nr:hypothetical protein [Streptomyces mobaraensis]KAB7850040.1 hypothetical protein FRZ00_05350 [Streptomyces mobaraensis]
MSDETATTEHPRAALPAGGTMALLYDTALVLVRTRTRRRIPFEAVERVDGPGAIGLVLLWLGLDSAVPTALEAVRVLREG